MSATHNRLYTEFEPVITHGGEDRGYKLCQCSVCGIRATCTPAFDFYTTTDATGLLKCETCFWDYARTVLVESGNEGKLDALNVAIAKSREAQ